MTKASTDQSRQQLSTPVVHLKGVGPRLAEKLAKLDIHTVEDLLYLLPHRYEDRREFSKIAQLRDGVHEVFSGEILASGEATTSRSRRKLFEAVVSDGTGQIVLKWFHYRKDWIAKRFVVGQRAVFTGEVKRYGATREIHHPDAEFLAPGQSLADYQSSDPMAFGRILPVYPLTEGLTQHAARKIWKQAVDHFARYVPSHLPDPLVKKHHLLPLADALLQVHWPANETKMEELDNHHTVALRSLVYDEFFFLELGLALKRRGVVLEQGIPFKVTHKYTKPLAGLLPYRLTNAQRRV
ncbi:MAG: DNA helicase RecG, partial [Desulfuromonadales bacterium]|nr:DNA helicase RecG [Desulfuromonadales bacterium]